MLRFASFLLLASLSMPAAAQLPDPDVLFVGSEDYSNASGKFTRYRFDVANKTVYPTELFLPAPKLPACGLNRDSSRSWVDLYDRDGKHLYGFCTLSSLQQLGSVWFAVPETIEPPSHIIVQIWDRQTDKKYRSKLVATSK